MFFIFEVLQELWVILKNAGKVSGYTNYFWSTKIQVHLMMPSWLGVLQKFDFSVMINNSEKKMWWHAFFLSCQNEGTPGL